MKNIALAMLAMTVIMAACTKGSDGSDPMIEIPGDGEPLVTLNSTDLSTKLMFTTNAAWKVSVSDTRGAGQWLTVSPMQGGAGNAELNLVAEPNTSSSAREMFVTITAGSGENQTQSTVTVKQKGKASAITIETVPINAAGQEFWMGPQTTIEDKWVNNNNQGGFVPDEYKHRVKLTRNFRMGKYEVTNAQYAEFLNDAGIKGTQQGDITVARAVINYTTYTLYKNWGKNNQDDRYNHYLVWNESSQKWSPSDAIHANKPVTNVTWWGAKAFADYVGGALPTEAQWEFAARCGTSTMFFFGNIDCDETTVEGLVAQLPLYRVAWYGLKTAYFTPTQLAAAHIDKAKTGGYGVNVVGQKGVSPWGLYDIYGNAMEWCYDNYGRFYGMGSAAELGAATITDPTGSASTREGKVQRGGCYILGIFALRSSARFYHTPTTVARDVGFRVIFME